MDKRTTVDANREERRALIDEWARQAQAGSQEAFIKITRHYERQLYNLYAGKHSFGVHIYDENNNRVDDLYENSMNIIDGKYHIDFLFTPFKAKPKSLTVKPYVQKVDRSSGKFGEKEYISELEFKVDLK